MVPSCCFSCRRAGACGMDREPLGPPPKAARCQVAKPPIRPHVLDVPRVLPWRQSIIFAELENGEVLR